MERVVPGDPVPSSDGELDRLLEAYCERARRGEQPTIEEYIALRPDLAEDIRLLFPASLAMEDLAGAASAEEPAAPARIGDYRIVREIGRGGMGIVYEAVQESLDRRVALKVLPRSLLSDGSGLERFRREARSAARLHHTNIVPIFAVGEEAGLNYYAMQFIDGRSLDAILEAAKHGGGGGSTFPDLTPLEREIRDETRERGGSSGASSPERRHHRAVAEVGLQAAEALAYAHAQGILHRDIKPSNLLLDRLGTVWITDFGLAKADEGPHGTPALTQAGDIIGTIAYLAPERLEGKADARSDVYALGLTLHELLTLEPAFQDENRRRLLKRVAGESPRAPREIDPTIPRDLETIILTASAKDPAHRYAGAALLADDLRSFLAGRPIAARRPTVVERLGSWCRREPALAGLGALVLVLLAAVAVLSTYGYVRVSELLGIANENLGRAQSAEEQARTELRRAHGARARASRMNPRPGRRFDCLESVSRAASLQPGPDEIPALRAEAIAALATVDMRLAQSFRIEPGLAFTISPDFETYAVADSSDTRVSIHRASDQAELASLPVVGAMRGTLNFSPDGRFLAMRLERGADRFAVFEVGPQRRLYTSRIVVPGTGLDFHPSSRKLAWMSQESGELHYIELAEAREVARHEGRPGYFVLGYDPSGGRLALASGRESQILLLEAETGRLLSSVDDEGRLHTAMGWSPDGKLLAVGCVDGSSSIWEASGDILRRSRDLDKARATLARVLFNHRGTLLATYSWDPALRLWDPWSGDLLLAADVTGFSFSPDDRRLAFAGATGQAGTMEVVESEVCRGIPPPDMSDAPTLLEVSPDGRLLACGREHSGTVLFDLEERRYLATPPQLERALVHFAADGEWLVARDRTGLRRWPMRSIRGGDAAQATPEESIGEAHTVSSIWITGTADASTLAVLGNRDRGEIVVFTRDGDGWRSSRIGPHMSVNRIALRPDGKRLASGTWLGADVKVWDLETSTLERTMPMRRNAYVEYSPDGRWLAVMTPEGCILHDAVTLDVLHRIRKVPQGGYTGRATFRPDCKVMAMSYDPASILLVDPATGAELARLEAPSPLARTLVFHPDGTRLYCGAMNGGFFEWDLDLLRRELRALGVDWVDPRD